MSQALRCHRDRRVREDDSRNSLEKTLLACDGDPTPIWRSTLQALVVGSSPALGTEAHILGCLIAADGIMTTESLNRAWHQLQHIYRAGRDHCLDWKGPDGRQDRRHVSDLTVLSLACTAAIGPLRDAQDALCRALGISPFDSLLSHLRDSMRLHLSGDLSAHVSDQCRMTAVSRETLFRRITNCPLLTNVDGPQGNVKRKSPSIRLMMRPPRMLGFTAAVLGAVRASDNVHGHKERRRLIEKALEALSERAHSEGWLATLSLLTAQRLVRDGLAPNTIDSYLSVTLHAIDEALVDMPISGIADERGWSMILRWVRSECSVTASQRSSFAACIRIVGQTLGELAKKRLPPISLPRIETYESAGLVFEREIDTIVGWLSAHAGESRLHDQCRTMLRLLAAAPLRYGDLFLIHVRNVSISHGVLTIGIDPDPSMGRGKTIAARREIVIEDVHARDAVQSWLARRYSELAELNDLLFGHPNEPRAQWRVGASNRLLRLGLKAATGDPTIRIHHLRHSVLSLRRETLGWSDDRALEQIACDAGHSSLSSFRWYSHLWPTPLRRQLDSAIQILQPTEKQVCALTGLGPGTVRKRWQRDRVRDRREVSWNLIRSAAAAVQLPNVAESVATATAVSPYAVSRPNAFDLERAVSLLRDLAAGIDVEHALSRHCLDAAVAKRIARAINEWMSGVVARSAGGSLPFRTWAHSQQAKWKPLKALLREADVLQLSVYVDDWIRCLHHPGLSLDRHFPTSLLALFADSGIAARDLILCQTGLESQQRHQLSQQVNDLFGSGLQMRFLQPRRGRATAYLLVASKAGVEHQGAAGVSIDGLNALMFGCWLVVKARDAR